MGLFGSYYVTPTPTAITRAWKICKEHVRDFQAIRSHGLKLAFWPGGLDSECADLDWDWIEGLKDKRIGELRIDEVIVGNNNLRIVFFKANRVLPRDPVARSGEPMIRIWPMIVFQKKRNDFSTREIAAFCAARQIIVLRYYDGANDA